MTSIETDLDTGKGLKASELLPPFSLKGFHLFSFFTTGKKLFGRFVMKVVSKGIQRKTNLGLYVLLGLFVLGFLPCL